MDFLKNTELATDRSQRRAIELSATVITATVAAVSATTADLLLADGTTVPNVNVLEPYTPRVGEVVRVIAQGSTLLVIGGRSVPNAVPASGSLISVVNVTATTMSPLPSPGPLKVRFVTPRSGAVVVHLRSRGIPTASARVMVGFRVLTTGGTAVFTEGSPVLEYPPGAAASRAGATQLVTGLTPGTSYDVEAIAATGVAGQTVVLADTRILVQPSN